MRVLGAIGLVILGLPATAFADTGQLVATDGPVPECRPLRGCPDASACPGGGSGEVCTTVGDPTGTFCNWGHNSFLCCTTADDAACSVPGYVGTCVAVAGAFTTTPETDGFDGVCVFREGMPPDTFCGEYDPASIARCLSGPPGAAISWWDGDCDGDMFANYEYPDCDPCDPSENPGDGCDDVDGGAPSDDGGGRPDGGRVEPPPMLSGSTYRGGGGCVCTIGPRREVGFGPGFATLVALIAWARRRRRRRHTQP